MTSTLRSTPFACKIARLWTAFSCVLRDTVSSQIASRGTPISTSIPAMLSASGTDGVSTILARPESKGIYMPVPQRSVLEETIPTEFAVQGSTRVQLEVEAP